MHVLADGAEIAFETRNVEYRLM